jgi:hypothetical protein
MSQGMFARNDWAGIVRLKTVNSAGKVVPLETGVVTAFLAETNAPDATEIDPTLVGVVTYLGCNGDWLVKFDGSILDEALLDAAAAVYVIIDLPGDVRVYADAQYQSSREALVV